MNQPKKVGPRPARPQGAERVMNDEAFMSRCVQQLRAVADASRLRILLCLRDGPKNVSEIAALLETAMVNVSHHLGVLRHAGILRDEKQGRWVVYQLAPDVLAADGSRAALTLDLSGCKLTLPEGKW
jgi:ArsR family transcriptional regulator